MGTKGEDPRDTSPQEVEREIRRNRNASLGDAIAHEGGSGLLKGASPVAHQRQLEFAAEELLDARLRDPEGALRRVLLREVHQMAETARREDAATPLLISLITEILSPGFDLADLVRQADAEWGRMYDERPHFERSGTEPKADDPYTLESVRAQLTALLDRLRSG